MFGSFIEKLSGIFDQRFWAAYWIPSLIAACMSTGVLTVLGGLDTMLSWWTGLESGAQILLGAVIFLITVLIAYLLQALTPILVRMFEGYNWPVHWFAHQARMLQLRTRDKLQTQVIQLGLLSPQIRQQRAQPFAQPTAGLDVDYLCMVRYHHFPRDTSRVLPTQLGNVLAAAEEHSYELYRLDAIVWWPRLVAILPKEFGAQVDAALVGMQALLNLSLVCGFVAFAGGVSLLVVHSWAWFAAVFGGGIVLAWLAYRAALGPASDYGELIRVAFDLYRHEILRQMRIPLPENLVHERYLWNTLNEWIYTYAEPWKSGLEGIAPQLTRPFVYANADGRTGVQPMRPAKSASEQAAARLDTVSALSGGMNETQEHTEQDNERCGAEPSANRP